MRLITLLMGFGLGVVLTVVIYSTLPMHWDNSGYWKRAEKNKGKIVVVIGYDPNCRHICETFESINQHQDREWNESFVVSFKDKNNAFKLRGEVIKTINDFLENDNANSSNYGQR